MFNHPSQPLSTFSRQVHALGNASVRATSLLQPAEKRSFADKGVPKYNLGTREPTKAFGRGLIWVENRRKVVSVAQEK
jgi:hypothetical protein